MKQHSGPVGRLAALRVVAQRFAFMSMVVASFALMLLGKADNVLVERTRMVVGDALAPILDVMARPAASIADVVNGVRELAALRAENVRLRDENVKLMHWQTVARQLDHENRSLRAQINFIADPDPSFVTARVIGDTGGPFVQTILINAGSRDGVRKGQVVIAGEVLVGRVISVWERASRVLLVTDPNSRIPVTVESSRVRAILAGDHEERPRLNFIAGSPPLAPGDRVVTSGAGGAIPPGIPVGVIAAVGDGIVRIEPFIYRHQLEYVTVVDYGLGGILPSATQAENERGERVAK